MTGSNKLTKRDYLKTSLRAFFYKMDLTIVTIKGWDMPM